MRFTASLLLAYLLFGTFITDRFMGGKFTAGWGLIVVAGMVVLCILFFAGIWCCRRYREFLGFSFWQWSLLPPGTFFIGVAYRLLS